jgi:hypothetical protein
MRIDIDMDSLLRELAKKNNISIVQASREIARLSRVKLSNRKFYKEIKI